MSKRMVENRGATARGLAESLAIVGGVSAPWGIGVVVVSTAILLPDAEARVLIGLWVIFVPMAVVLSTVAVIGLMRAILWAIEGGSEREQRRGGDGRFISYKKNGKQKEAWVRVDPTTVKHVDGE